MSLFKGQIAQHLRDLLQHLVARNVAESVIDLLELVHVDDQQQAGLPLGNGLVDLLLGGHAVVEVGQPVPLGKLGQPLVFLL